MRQLHRLAGRVFNTPLAIAPDKAAVIAAVLTASMAGVQVDAAAGYDSPEQPPELEVDDDGVGWIQIAGTLVEKSSWLDSACGFVSYNTISAQLRQADADGRVRGILLVIDSPGGEVTGMFGCAKVLGGISKPVYAAVNHCACSAAYLLASQCSRIFVTEDSLVGSIGVIAQHMEMSGRDAEAGLKYTTLYAGARKNDGNPHEPLSDGARAAIQADIDDLMDRFVGLVSQARGISAAAVRGTEAALFRAERAIGAGLADQMGTPTEAAASLIARVGPRRPSATILGLANPKGAAGGHAVADSPEALSREEILEICYLCEAAGQARLLHKFVHAEKKPAQVAKELRELSDETSQSEAGLLRDTSLLDEAIRRRREAEAARKVN